MDYTTVRPIILLYIDRSSGVNGATRFQKLIFLSQMETELPELYDYDAYKFGPYSNTLAKDIDTFIENGLINRYEVENEVGNVKHIYSLTNKGYRVAKKISERSRQKKAFEELTKVKKKYNDQRLGDLLRYVYNRYPDYTTETDLDLDSLFDPDSHSQFLEPDILTEEASSFIETIRKEEGTLSNDFMFERSIIEVNNNTQLQIERYEDNRASVYWLTEMELPEFLQATKRDPNVTQNSRFEIYTSTEPIDYLTGKLSEIADELDATSDIDFIALESLDASFEITWEQEAYVDSEKNEMTILFNSNQISLVDIRPIVSRYLTPTIDPNYKVESDKLAPETNLSVKKSISDISEEIKKPV